MDKATKEEINEYINGIKTGDDHCLEMLYSTISANVRHIALKYLKNEFDADDLVQDFWADIHKISLGFIFNQNGFSYLCKVMTRRAINRYRQIHREKCQKIDFVDYQNLEHCVAKDDIENCERNIVLDNAIAQLSKMEKIVIQLVYFEDKTVREIAKELKISKSQVSNIKIAAIEKLKKELD